MEPPTHVVDLAILVSTFSPCRSKRGAVVFQGEQILANGYNFKPRGFECDGSETCKSTCSVQAIHAEQAALMGAGVFLRGAEMLHAKTVNGHLVASGGPSCVQCSKLSLAAGIAGVWLHHDAGWKRYDTIEFHRLSLRAATPPEARAPQEEQP